MGVKSDLIATRADLAKANARIAELEAKYEPKPDPASVVAELAAPAKAETAKPAPAKAAKAAAKPEGA